MKPINDKTMIKDGDIQLWVVVSKANGLQVPVWATPHRHMDSLRLVFWRVQIATTKLDKHWHDVVMELIISRRVNYDPEICFLSEASLMTIAYKAPGITPDYYLKVDDTKRDVSPEIDVSNGRTMLAATALKPVDPHAEQDAFIAHVADKCGLDAGEFRLHFSAMCAVLPYYLVHERKPVRFGAITLVALPLRSDFANRWFTKNLDMLEDPDSEFEPERFRSLLGSPELKAIDAEKHFCLWSVHAVPEAKFDEISRSRDAKLLQASGGNGYLTHHQNQIAGMEPYIVAALKAFRRQANKPLGKLYASGFQSGSFLVPDAPERTIPRGDWLHQKRRIPGPTEHTKKRKALADATQEVRQVSRLQPDTADVRSPIEERTDPSWVPVSHADKGSGPESEMLGANEIAGT